MVENIFIHDGKNHQIKNAEQMNPDNSDEFCLIPEFEKYVINGYGAVWSLYRKCFIKHFINVSDYKIVMLHKNHSQKAKSIHYLLAGLFIPNPNNYKFVVFKDDNKENTYYKNLEWSETQTKRKPINSWKK